MDDSDLERTLRMLKLHDQPRLRAEVEALHGSVARAWLVLGQRLEFGDGTRRDRVSAREAYKVALKGDNGVGTLAAFHLATLLERHPELQEEYTHGGRTYGTTAANYFKEGAKLAVQASDARFRFWAPNQRSIELAAAIAPLITRRRQDATFGNPDAMYELSQLLLEGFGVPRDAAGAASWLYRAAAAGHLGAACRLRPENWHEVARRAVAPALASDNAPALGSGMPADVGDAPVLGGEPSSPFQLLRAGLPPMLAVRWPASVPPPQPDDAGRAEAGDVDAQLRLGAASEDADDAAYWLLLAAAGGHPSAFPLRDALPACPEAETRAAIWWERNWDAASDTHRLAARPVGTTVGTP